MTGFVVRKLYGCLWNTFCNKLFVMPTFDPFCPMVKKTWFAQVARVRPDFRHNTKSDFRAVGRGVVLITIKRSWAFFRIKRKHPQTRTKSVRMKTSDTKTYTPPRASLRWTSMIKEHGTPSVTTSYLKRILNYGGLNCYCRELRFKTDIRTGLAVCHS